MTVVIVVIAVGVFIFLVVCELVRESIPIILQLQCKVHDKVEHKCSLIDVSKTCEHQAATTAPTAGQVGPVCKRLARIERVVSHFNCTTRLTPFYRLRFQQRR